MDAAAPKAAEPTPPTSSSPATSTAQPPTTTTAPPPQPTMVKDTPLPTPSEPIPKVSTSAETTHTNDGGPMSPPFSPSSTTPVLEKEELDFTGNVEVNDDIPTEKELKRVENLLVLDAEGTSRPFKTLYSGPGVAPRQLIIFVRHFFCGNCQEYLRTLSSSITPDMLLTLPAPTFITVIGCGRPELIPMYIETTSCPFPVYADPTRKLYDYLGMTRTLSLGPQKPSYIQSNLFVTSVQSIVQSLKTGNKALKGGDFKQVGGEFLFENGECVWAHRMRNTRDHAEIVDLRRRLGLDETKPPMRKRWSHGIKEMGKGGRERSSSWGKVRVRSKNRGLKGEDGLKEKREEEEMGVQSRPTV
ncbi:AhpC/TSA antioxidant enzyme-domain-containing protein [Clohesyomyces aquaticus]|uniref:AhpC/TSA antioxidant enzyme-domain-containing protein n=1 Tax=Clohesyomyces aquaticus TaxID=1231657 RepID=A0A1Y1ZFF2_9PLEO|nr:AhpC/TSA antioxidant enzyme-domain-containing protein [Clohesyomyces aquaticus]